jgi:hypothetical protein
MAARLLSRDAVEVEKWLTWKASTPAVQERPQADAYLTRHVKYRLRLKKTLARYATTEARNEEGVGQAPEFDRGSPYCR